MAVGKKSWISTRIHMNADAGDGADAEGSERTE